MFDNKNIIAWKNGIKRVIGDSDKTKKFFEYVDGVLKLVNVKSLIKTYGCCIIYLIIVVAYRYKIIDFFKSCKRAIKNADVKSNDGKSNLMSKCFDHCYKVDKAIEFLNERNAITDFIACYCKHYAEENLTIANFDEFIINTYYNKDIYETQFSSFELDIPLYFHYYTIAMVCIEIMNANGWLNSIENFDKYIDNNIDSRYWYNDMKTALNSREEDKGELLYKLTVIGLLRMAKREIESSQED